MQSRDGVWRGQSQVTLLSNANLFGSEHPTAGAQHRGVQPLLCAQGPAGSQSKGPAAKSLCLCDTGRGFML